MSDKDPDEPREGNGAGLEELGADVDAAVSKAVRTVELGRRGFAIAVAVFGLVVGLVLPWVGEHFGWEVLAGEGGAIPRLFATTSTVFGVAASALALATRRWWLTWVCAIGSWIAAVDGLLAIWSQQSSSASGAPGDGPGVGMIIAVVCMVVLGVQWVRVAWSRN
ncbi:Rv2732c family membrane protein [Prauserella flavalba]|uniref:Transmembrane protein n=1 Tax=Prauserella flavalba TaxID=1477506 RepID=A0A318LP29_9PSEU|nr:hypothetical protein [Prauserella flavalba]PXY28767.1 hypothetical protein BA062_23310 [Prauserella flavalba]